MSPTVGALLRRFMAAITLALVAGALLHAQPPAAAPPLDSEVKAVYLLNFGRFATWPAGVAADRNVFNVCVLGHDPFGSVLDATVAGETIDGKSVATRRIAKPQDAAGCRILFVSASEEAQLKPILSTIEKTGVLTVSDLPQFVERGGMIQFVADGRKVRFEVNVAAVDQAGLTLSSELLRVAMAVRTKP